MVKKKRSMSRLDDLMSQDTNSSDNDSATAGISTDKQAYATGNEHLRLSDVRLSYKNKRVVTQLIRFVPDWLVDEANFDSSDKEQKKSFILDRIDKIPVNNVIREFRKSDELGDNVETTDSLEKQDLVEMRKYARHDDLYCSYSEGIFIGRGICFHNLSTSNKQLLELSDSFVEAVNINGSSIDINKEADVIEKPKIVRVGGQRGRLVYGHQRYCYLVYAYGIDHIYAFLTDNNVSNQNRKILIENNNKRPETGYEQLLSYYHTALESELEEGEELLRQLALSKTEWYRIRPFVQDPTLIDIAKKKAINLPRRTLTDIIESIKKGLRSTGHNKPTNAMLRDAFASKLDAMHGNIQKDIAQPQQEKQSRLTVRLPEDKGQFEKLFFEDVRNWSTLDVKDYDLSTKKGIKKYLNDLLEEL